MKMNNNIFIVDDHPGIRLLLTEVFMHEGYDVTTATTGKEALDRINSDSFDIILLDNNLPIMDGMEIVEQLNQSSFTTPIVLMSGLSDQLKNKATHFPFVKAVVAKPFNLDEIQALVKEFI